MKSDDSQKQRLVESFFDKNAAYWRDTYQEENIQGIIYQFRQKVALNYIDGLPLSRRAHVLEIGCGAGLLTRALGQRGFTIEAIDSSEAMIELTRSLAADARLGTKINAHLGDVNNLQYPSESFDVVVALGVVPWLLDFKKALLEIIRVLRPGGFVLLTMDNASRATTLLDPLTFPPIEFVIGIVKREFGKVGLFKTGDLWINCPPYRRYKPKEFIDILVDSGLQVLKKTSVGFGPFTFIGRNVFSDPISIKINFKLQNYADNQWPIFRSTGSQYIVLSRKR